MEDIKRFFADGGYLSEVIDNYQMRPGQVKLAEWIDQAIRDKQHFLGEGPCGVGKSMAYLVPAVFAAKRDKARTAIATANIGLQHQIMEKDLPMLQEAIPFDFSFTLLKGRANYFCLRLAARNKKKGLSANVSQDQQIQARELAKWGTDETTTGDKEKVPFQVDSFIWSLFSSSAEECDGTSCDYRHDCFCQQAIDRAQTSDIIILNYHLLFADLSLRLLGIEDPIIPHCDIIIGDEAHKSPEIARNFFGFDLTRRTFAIVAGYIRDYGNKSAKSERLFKETNTLSSRYFALLRSFYKSSDYKIKLREPLGNTSLGQPTKDLWKHLDSVCQFIKEVDVSVFSDEKEEGKAKKKRRRRLLHVSNLMNRLAHFYSPDDENMINWIELYGKSWVKLVARPFDIRKYIKGPLFADHKSVIFVSATLTSQGNFDFITDALGIAEDTRLGVGIIDSPFNHERQAILVIPQEAMDPRKVGFPAFSKYVTNQVDYLAKLFSGNILCLFTSYRMINAVHKALQDTLPEDITLLRQGDAPRHKLIEQFKEGNTVLIGTESFWQGVDVPGKALSCVVIDKMPFETPDDPIQATGQEKYRDWFMRSMVPKATILLRQGTGRLIRTVKDRGAIVIFDNRILTKNWGVKLLTSLEKMTTSSKIEDTITFTEGGTDV